MPLHPSPVLSPRQHALHHLALWLRGSGYEFVTVTPETHRRVRAQRAGESARTLRDIFGWNMDFALELLPAEALDHLRRAEAIALLGDGFGRSLVRFASFNGQPYVHSAYPTSEGDSVFCGPDTYRFISLIERELEGSSALSRVLDVGCGAGAGGLLAGHLLKRSTGGAPRIELVDVNERALDMARVNAATIGLADVAFRCSDLYRGVAEGLDLIVANPPFLIDADERLYRHGGGLFGSALSERIVKEGLPMLAPGGKLVLYTGSAIVEGKDAFKTAASRLIDASAFDLSYREIDPDVFGEELERPAYEGVERIAAVGMVVRRRAGGS